MTERIPKIKLELIYFHQLLRSTTQALFLVGKPELILSFQSLYVRP